jgi:hypothetical protein
MNVFLQQILRFDFEKQLDKSIRLRVRFEFNHIKDRPDTENGVNFYHDIRWQALKNLIFMARYSTFATPSYDSRVYEFENDLPYMFSSRSLYGKGVKWYLFVKWSYAQKVDVQIKYHIDQKYIYLHHIGHSDIDREIGFFVKYRL